MPPSMSFCSWPSYAARNALCSIKIDPGPSSIHCCFHSRSNAIDFHSHPKARTKKGTNAPLAVMVFPQFLHFMCRLTVNTWKFVCNQIVVMRAAPPISYEKEANCRNGSYLFYFPSWIPRIKSLIIHIHTRRNDCLIAPFITKKITDVNK